MGSRFAGKVVLVSGAARGQGRSHAVRFAEEGADVVAVDICAQIGTVGYPMSTPEDLAETVRRVEAADHRICAVQADVRDAEAMSGAVERGMAEFGRIDIVCANAGIASYAPALQLTTQMWRDMIDVQLTGVWNLISAALPPMVEGGRGGAIVITSSAAGLRSYPNLAHYAAAKHGVVGLMRGLAADLATYHIRVNTVHPGTVDTPMVQNEFTRGFFMPDKPDGDKDAFAAASMGMQLLPVPWVEAVDVSNSVLFLASDEGRYITGTALSVDAGAALR